MKSIKYLVMDVDGTLTDGKIYQGNNGELFKAFDVKDGYAIANMLPDIGIIPIIITGRTSDIVLSRAADLGIKRVYQGVKDKKAMLNSITDSYETISIIGDDLNDIEMMKAVKESGGLVGAPIDAVNDIKVIADFISEKKGGDGAVREFVEWIREANKNKE